MLTATTAALRTSQLMRRWRMVAGGRAVQFGPAELNQLHLVEVALRLEAPEIGGCLCDSFSPINGRA